MDRSKPADKIKRLSSSMATMRRSVVFPENKINRDHQETWAGAGAAMIQTG